MAGKYREKRWEFWLGMAFIAVAVSILVPAFAFESWREIVSKLGASVAAFAVVGASLIAYSGAVAKVRLDRESETEKSVVLRRNLFLKTHMAAAQLYEEASAAVRRLRVSADNPAPTRYSMSELTINEPEGLQQAWDALDTIPAECVPAMRGIRLHVGRLTRLIEGTAEINYVGFDGERRIEQVFDEINGIVNDAKEIIDVLQPKLVEGAPAAAAKPRKS